MHKREEERQKKVEGREREIDAEVKGRGGRERETEAGECEKDEMKTTGRKGKRRILGQEMK